ncbi:tumor necrosis factor receptor superfamily member EDAR-like isoform X1 [Erpetoichthys calabaricus]|uniref:Tumor necrosis factor receptor superfamily member EDAR-like n=2 Tax=Erpetoichthys calabaricus TaxID=27687 RepID=A0A8C4SPN5_ERPCA|nr:tumor necrosis factor receptor superfamily member EDAR-like isoform X1 [Erpetoichthys calabaricus]
MGYSSILLKLLVLGLICSGCSGCSETQYHAADGACKECKRCPKGQELSEECGFGFGAEAYCVECKEGWFSMEHGSDPCRRCTQCSVENREEIAPCKPISNSKCGRCKKGFYEVKRSDGDTEKVCFPCQTDSSYECQGGRIPSDLRTSTTTAQIQENLSSESSRIPAPPIFMIAVGSVLFTFIVLLLISAITFIMRRIISNPKIPSALKDTPEGCLEKLTQDPKQKLMAKKDLFKEQKFKDSPTLFKLQSSPNLEKEPQHHAIVINVTTNVKSHSEEEDEMEELPKDKQLSKEEMKQKLEEINGLAKGKNLESLDYDTLQDISLLVNSGGRGTLKRLGRALCIQKDILSNLNTFEDLFEYLRTSTYTDLPGLALAAACIHRSDIVSKLHKSLIAGS